MRRPVRVRSYKCAICGAEEISSILPQDWSEAGELVCDNCIHKLFRNKPANIKWLDVLEYALDGTASKESRPVDFQAIQTVAVPLLLTGLVRHGDRCMTITALGRRVYKRVKKNIDKLKPLRHPDQIVMPRKKRGDIATILREISNRLHAGLPYKRDDIMKMFTDFSPYCVSNAIQRASVIGLLVRIAFGQYVFLEPVSDNLLKFSNDPILDFLWPGRATL